jgi:hypothetical protein
MTTARERHARETASIAGLAAGGVSRESVRKTQRALEKFGEPCKAAMLAGEVSANKAYRWSKGDRRVGLHVMVSPELRFSLRVEAARRGVTVAEIVNAALTQIFGERELPKL